jgi:diacylglycerol O-acyltransferase
MKRIPLNLNDASWLHAETRRTPMQIGLLATFSKPAGAAPSYVADLVERWRGVQRFEAPYNYLAHGTARRTWEVLPDDQIDLDYHFRHSALPAPGGERELGVLVSRLHSARMDRQYPLWECHVIEGLYGGRWAIYMKSHHSQVDGVGGIRLARRIFSVDPDDADMLPPWAIGTRGPDQSGIPPVERVRAPKEKVGAKQQLAAVRVVTRSLGKAYREAVTGADDPSRGVQWRAPRSVLNGRISAHRRFASQHYPIDRIKAVAAAADGSINDVFLAICSGALRRYLSESGDLPEASLVANVPVSVRTTEGASVGNSITFLFAQIGTDIEDPLERIKAIRESTQSGKDQVPDVSGAAMDAYTAGLMGPFLTQALLGAGGKGRPSANLVISNVPGLQEQRYLSGSKIEEFYPLSLLWHGQGLNITAVSNAGWFDVGFTGCKDSVPHLQRIAVYAGEALDELESALELSWKDA